MIHETTRNNTKPATIHANFLPTHNSLTKRILIFRIGELGDTLVSLPALRAVREFFPEAHIGLLGNVDAEGKNVRAQDVLPADGLIDEWLHYPTADGSRSWMDSLGLLARLKRCGFDTLVYLAPRIRSAKDVRRDLFFFRLAGIRRVIGGRGFDPLPAANGSGSLPTVSNEVDHLLARLALDGVTLPPAANRAIDLRLTEAEQERADEWLQRRLAGMDHLSIVGFGPGSKWPSKVWPEERYLEVGRRLIESDDVLPVVFGGAEDRTVGERLISGWERGANAAGELTVRESAAALRRCELYLGNDTGTMHLAAAVGTPCVVVMSALDWPGHWNPYGAGHTVLRRSVPCEGCLLRVCEREGMRCLKEIGVDEVLGACRHTLAKKSCSHSLHQENVAW